ncbi:MAG: hypothetical protein HQK63_12525 [Desulfamplus sp.]|nr:hypothetical protein [Desulfamplus sp.]
MKYDKSLIEVFKWKEESGNELYNMTIGERLRHLQENEKRRKHNLNTEKSQNQITKQKPSPILL